MQVSSKLGFNKTNIYIFQYQIICWGGGGGGSRHTERPLSYCNCHLHFFN